MNRMKLCLFSALAVVALTGPTVDAQVIAVFDETTYPTNPLNGFGAFTFDDFSATGAFTDGPDSLILDVQDSNASNGVFGGVGVDYIIGGVTTVDFNPNLANLEMRLKILPNNAATAIRATYIDHDGGFPVGADEYIYEFDLTGVPADSQFHVLTKPASGFLFFQPAFNFAAGNSIQDPGLRQMQIQSVFGSTGRLNVEVDYVRFVGIPEPATLALLALAAPALSLAVRRRRGT